MMRCKNSATAAPRRREPNPYSMTVALTAPVATASISTQALNPTPINGNNPPRSKLAVLVDTSARCCHSAAAAVSP
jgi:hypothetical protein